MTSIRSMLVAAGLTIATVAQAGNTLYLNEADYLSAVGPTVGFTEFTGSPASPVLGDTFLPDVVFFACGTTCSPSVFHNSDGITDLGGSSASNGVGQVGGFFTGPVSAFGFHYVSGSVHGLLMGDGSLIDTTAANGFIGVVSTSPQTFFIAINAVFPSTGGNDRYFLDDFRINAAVPEPSGWMMLAAGGLLLTQRLRRRARG